MSIRKRAAEYIRKYGMIEKGDTVCIGFSGGADSVCLFLLLHELSGEMGFRLTAFHVNHCLRGEESDGDEAFVTRFCAERNVPLKVFRYEVGTIASEMKKGTEETGRILRHKAAEEAAEYFSASKTALAHHANDNAETILFQLVRGSSLGGLKGILPVNGRVIRPLLFAERGEIEEELRQRGIAWREDATNQDCSYSRNLIRNRILPELSKLNAGAVKHINESAADLAEADAWIRQEAEDRLSEFSDEENGGLLLKNGILTESRMINGRIALAAMERISHSAVDLERIHAEALCGLFGKQTGRVIELPYRMTARRTYRGVLIAKTEEKTEHSDKDSRSREDLSVGRENTGILPEETALPVNGSIGYHGLTIRTDLLELSAVPKKIPEKRYTKWFDYDKINRCGCIRTGQTGDFLVINAQGGRKKLKDYFINEKVPSEERSLIPCLACGHEILWVIGYRIGETAKVTAQTVRVIRIQITGDGIHE